MMNNGIKTNLKSLLKRNKSLYQIYYGVMTTCLNLIKLFVKTDEKLILFLSFGGRRCADSPKAIYEYIRNDSRFSNYTLVWGFVNPEKFPEIEHKVKIDTLRYFIISIKARCWVTNVHIERGLGYTGKNTFYLYTGHGSPIKKCGTDVKSDRVFKSLAKGLFSSCLAQSDYEREIRSRLSTLPREEVYLTGSPTNDILANYDIDFREETRKRLGIKKGIIAILYAPTFREYDNSGSFEMPEADFDKWHHCLGENYVILYRAHPISNSSSLRDRSWFIDVTKWDDIEPLMIASDILISDYSGLITDYSIMHKPIYLWTYDYEQYEKARGLYFDVREVLPYAAEEDAILSMIKDGYSQEQFDMLYRFQQEYATVYGNATSNAVDLIFNKIVKR